MKPLALTLRGFASFRQETVIPFADLAEHRLFAISGVTGSGKSSILDAMSYVLYGRTPRLGSSGLDEALLSQGADKIFVSLCFESDTGTYRATRSVEWTIKPSGESKKGSADVRIEKGTLQNDGSLKWKNLPESDKVRSAYKKIEEILGLDYEGFTRAIILPQGAFAEFLRGEASQRRNLLMKLLGAERISEMQKLARQRASDAQKELSFLQQRLEQLASATPKQRQEWQVQLDTIEKAITTGDNDLENYQITLEKMARLRDFIREKVELEQKSTDLVAQRPAMTQLQHKLEKAHQALALQPQEQRYVEWQQRVSLLDNQQQKYRNIAQDTARDLEAIQQRSEDIAQKRQYLEQKRVQSEALQQIQPQLEQLQRETGNLDILRTAKSITGKFDIDVLDHLKRLSYQLPTLYQREKDSISIKEKIEALTGSLELQQDAITQAQDKVSALREDAIEMHSKLEKLQQELARAQEHADRALHVNALREGLQVGDPCPFCAEPLTSLPEVEDNQLTVLKKACHVQEKAVNDAKSLFNEARDTYNTLAASYQRDKDYVNELTQRLQDNTADIEERRKIFIDVTDKHDSIADIELGLQQKIELQWHALAEAIRKQARDAALDLESVSDISALEALKNDIKVTQEAIEAYQNALHKAENAHNLAQRDFENAQKQYQDGDQQYQSVQDTFIKALQDADFVDIDAWRATLIDDIQLQAMQQNVDNYQQSYQHVQQRLEVVNASLNVADMKDISDDYETRYQESLRAKQQLEQEIQQQREYKGRISAQLEQLEKDLAEKASLEKNATVLEHSYSTFEQLNKDLQQKNFQEFIIGRMQQDLAQRAGALMHDITNGRYRLYFNVANGVYTVADAWNGGEPRDVRTLSGGETFIASLSLALALSDTVGNRSLEALFLDEGFGTLDSQTLESVAQVLENLSEQGRMVGIITHVQELTERLPARLEVSKSENGSKVWLDAS